MPLEKTDLNTCREYNFFSWVPPGHRWPLLVIVGQLSILAIGWGFYAAVVAKGQIPLPVSVANTVQLHPESREYMVTFISVILSTITSFLFAQAIRHGLVVRLASPDALSVSTLGYGMTVGHKSLIWDVSQIHWTLTAAFFSLAGITQTPGWTTLFTPRLILIHTPLQGTEIDFSSPAFQESYQSLSPFVNKTVLWTALIPLYSQSGFTATSARFGDPGYIRLDEFLYNVSTNGILALNLQQSNHSFGFDSPIPVRTFNTTATPQGLSTNYSMTQQGLTANVSCSQVNLSPTSDPPLNTTVQTLNLSLPDNTPLTLFWWEWSTSCNGVLYPLSMFYCYLAM